MVMWAAHWPAPPAQAAGIWFVSVIEIGYIYGQRLLQKQCTAWFNLYKNNACCIDVYLAHA
jgi:hypothetical protein